MGEISTAASWSLGAVLVTAGVLKMLRPRAASAATRALLPTWAWPADTNLGRFLTICLSAYECLLGAGLLAGGRLHFVATLMTPFVFTAFLLVTLRGFRRQLPCSCFGAFSRRNIGPAEVGQAGFLLFLAVESFVGTYAASRRDVGVDVSAVPFAAAFLALILVLRIASRTGTPRREYPFRGERRTFLRIALGGVAGLAAGGIGALGAVASGRALETSSGPNGPGTTHIGAQQGILGRSDLVTGVQMNSSTPPASLIARVRPLAAEFAREIARRGETVEWETAQVVRAAGSGAIGEALWVKGTGGVRVLWTNAELSGREQLLALIPGQGITGLMTIDTESVPFYIQDRGFAASIGVTLEAPPTGQQVKCLFCQISCGVGYFAARYVGGTPPCVDSSGSVSMTGKTGTCGAYCN